MNDKTDDPGKGHPGGHSGPGDGARRPYATLNLTATEIGREGGSTATSPPGDAQRGTQGGSPAGSEAAAGALPPPPRDASARRQWQNAGARIASHVGSRIAAMAGWLAGAGAWAFRLIRGNAHLSHAVAGMAGAALTLAVAGVLGLLSGRHSLPPGVAQRLAALEQAQSHAQSQARPSTVPAGIADKLATADKRLSSLEEQAKALATIRSEQARLATEAKTLQARVSAPETAERLAKLEATLAALSADGGNAVGAADKLATKLAGMEKLAGEAGAMKLAAERLQRDLAALQAETAGLRQGLEALKASVEEAIPAKLASVERDLQAVKKTEGERTAGAQRVLLALEIASLKRALDRGDSYARELDSAKKAAGGAVDLAALDRTSTTGVPTLGALGQDFKRVVGAALDAEAAQADASVLDRLMAGARSVVRLRKTQYTPDDTSAEAILARMDAALKDGNIGEVLAQGKRLPPKAAAAAAGWLGQLEARYTADKAVTELEAAVKSSLAGPERKP